MSFIYTPDDIAVFLLKANFPLRYEQTVLHNLWTEQTHIATKYRRDESTFRRDVRQAAASYALDGDSGLDELDLIMRDVDPNYTLLSPYDEHDVILRFFKVIRLELLYIEGRDYYKIKLRRLLKQFKYKRRSQTLVQNINHAMTLLSLSPYLRGHVPCDISSIDIDDMIMIRLKV